MIDTIFNKKEFFQFIENNTDTDIHSLKLKFHNKPAEFDLNFALTQIRARKNSRKKLSHFFQLNDRFLFPSITAAEQATNQCVASFHALLIGTNKQVVDLTAGLGIDAFSIAFNGNNVIAIELDPIRYDILNYNKTLLANEIWSHRGNLQILNEDSITWLDRDDHMYDVLFIDPARRDCNNNRVFKLSDCSPNITEFFDLFIQKSDRIIIKCSPLLDINNVLQELSTIDEIILTCLKGECKEVLLNITGHKSNDDTNLIPIRIIDLNDNSEAQVEILSDWKFQVADIGTSGPILELSEIRVGQYIYDPNAGIHKLRSGEKLCSAFIGMKQFSRNSDLFIDTKFHYKFPGRCFKIIAIPVKHDLKRIKNEQFEVICRNYPLSATSLRKKLKVRSGGDKFIVASRIGGKEMPVILICEKVSNISSGQRNN